MNNHQLRLEGFRATKVLWHGKRFGLNQYTINTTNNTVLILRSKKLRLGHMVEQFIFDFLLSIICTREPIPTKCKVKKRLSSVFVYFFSLLFPLCSQKSEIQHRKFYFLRATAGDVGILLALNTFNTLFAGATPATGAALLAGAGATKFLACFDFTLAFCQVKQLVQLALKVFHPS